MGTVLFATDTYYVKYKFSGLNNILIECNYCEKILLENVKQGVVNGLLLKRTLQSHMRLPGCLLMNISQKAVKAINVSQG